MDEETIQPTEEESVVADYSDTPDAAPPPEPEPQPDLEARLKELEKKEKALQKGFQEIAEREKRIAAPKPTVDDDPLANLDPEAQKILDAFMEKKLGAYEQAVGGLLNDTMESEMESYAKAKDIDPEAMMEVVRDKGLAPKGFTRKDRLEVYDLAAAVVQANNRVDIDTLVNEKVEARLAELAEQGQIAGAPRPARTEVAPEGADSFNEDWPAEQKLSFWKKKGYIKE